VTLVNTHVPNVPLLLSTVPFVQAIVSLYQLVSAQTNIMMKVLLLVLHVQLNVPLVMLTSVVDLVKKTTSYTNVIVSPLVQMDIGLIQILDNVTLVTPIVRDVLVVLMTNVLNVTLQTSYITVNVSQIVHLLITVIPTVNVVKLVTMLVILVPLKEIALANLVTLVSILITIVAILPVLMVNMLTVPLILVNLVTLLV
jgi:hypothetical protein